MLQQLPEVDGNKVDAAQNSFDFKLLLDSEEKCNGGANASEAP